jgi:hypothetical protein
MVVFRVLLTSGVDSQNGLREFRIISRGDATIDLSKPDD